MTKERPILFSGAMVRAILDGRKTQTRRIIKLPETLGTWEPTTIGGGTSTFADGTPAPEMAAIWHTRTGATLTCRHGQPGDRLWVRESGVISKLAGTHDKPRIFRHDVPATPETGYYWVERTRDTGASYNVSGCSREAALLSPPPRLARRFTCLAGPAAWCWRSPACASSGLTTAVKRMLSPRASSAVPARMVTGHTRKIGGNDDVRPAEDRLGSSLASQER
ncbi:hypothetical protein [Cupriavidus necator]|uniref:hypothetical protein n=1 Tax=Cupriavidus necator TaxID=106590 RepID=UPI00068BBEDE|nr:hypothetical protein [Cupriavidus necator]